MGIIVENLLGLWKVLDPKIILKFTQTLGAVLRPIPCLAGRGGTPNLLALSNAHPRGSRAWTGHKNRRSRDRASGASVTGCADPCFRHPGSERLTVYNSWSTKHPIEYEHPFTICFLFCGEA
jgi:hypothetical protein